eukprot:UN0769
MLVLGLVEYLDPDLDAANAAVSWSSLSPGVRKVWHSTEQSIPLVGRDLGGWSLPAVITGMVVLFTAVQIRECVRLWPDVASSLRGMVDPTKQAEDKDRWFGFFKEFQHLLDCASVMLPAEVSRKFASLGKDPTRRVARVWRFYTKVAWEAAPSLWLSTLLIGLNFSSSHFAARLTMVASIATSFWSILKVLPDQLVDVHDNMVKPIIGWRYKAFMYVIPTAWVCLSLAVSACALVSLWRCPGHMFHMWMGCLEADGVD